MNKKKILKKIIIILTLIMVLSIFLTLIFDDTSKEAIFRFIWIALMFIITLLRGVWVVLEENNKIVGCIYFILAIIFILYVTVKYCIEI